jgi:hypothetical protein
MAEIHHKLFVAQVLEIDLPCIEIMFCRPVICRAILRDASMASEPEFQKKNESSEGSGIIGRRFSMRRK